MSVRRSTRNKAMDFLARREHSRQELAQKLRQRLPEATDIVAVLDKLASENLQSDSRFAESFMRVRRDAGYGPLKIRRELQHRGVAETIIDDTFSTLAIDWQLQLQRLNQKKYGDGVTSDRKELAKKSRFFQQKGYPYELIRFALQADH